MQLGLGENRMVNETIRGYVYIPTDTYLLLNIVLLVSLAINIILLIVTFYKLIKNESIWLDDDVDGGE